MRYYCLFSFIILNFLLLCSSILFIFLILKPKKPIFQLHSVHLDGIKIDTSSGKGVFLQASMASLLFVAQNFNKFGIRYSPSNFVIIYERKPVGVVKVPGFYQPPNCTNVTVIMHVLLKRFSIGRFINAKTKNKGGNSSKGTGIEVRIVGQVNVDCSIKADFGAETFNKGLKFMKSNKDLVLTKFPRIHQKCSLALCL